LQTPGSAETGASRWPSFHAQHTTHIADFLNQQLPDRYVALVEQSLQIRQDDLDDKPPSISSKPRPDITLYESAGSEPQLTMTATRVSPSWTYNLEMTLNAPEENFLPAVTILDTQDDPDYGRPITRIELLSPSNLPGHSSFDLYEKNRRDALRAGTALVELHYLHEYDVPLNQYPRRHAYNIFVNNPHPSVAKGLVSAYGFAVDEPFPMVRIPLADGETLDFNFGEAYHHTYQAGPWARLVNYAELPPRINTYSQADRERIRQRMAAVAETVAQS
jgi:hypothetical protein